MEDLTDKDKGFDSTIPGDRGRGISSTPTPPDGGWGWVVVAACFVLQAITMGMVFTFGVLLVAFLDEFHENEARTSLVGSIEPALMCFTGEWVIVLVNMKYESE